MQAIYASYGIVGMVLLYIGTLYLAVHSIQKASRWFDGSSHCARWPKRSSDLTVPGPTSKPVLCVVPDLARRKSESSTSHFAAKQILYEAYEGCSEAESCND